MRLPAAILWEPHTPWSVEEIELDPPRAGEVLVKLASSGMCRSDEHLVTGDLAPEPEAAARMGLERYPVIGGHEGAGEVVEVGPGVSTLKVGDHVALSFLPSCGRCPSCAEGRQQLCDRGMYLQGGRQLADRTSRHHARGRDLGLMCLLGTFAPYTVVHEDSCVVIDDDLPLEVASLVGCGVTTGWGSAVHAAAVAPGETVVVVGLGGVGLSAVQGAAFAGARHVVAVDPLAWKGELALTMGATHAVASMADALPLVQELTRGAKAHKAILTVDLALGAHIAELMALIRKAGRAVVTSVGESSGDVRLNLVDLAMQRKELVGCLFGNANARVEIPRLLGLYRDGRLKLDELVSRTYKLEEVNEGYVDLREGRNVRGLIRFD
ncbi:MAG: NDMA-dependent alcohol dehydrogenase [Sporichthyaceae bacterium]